MIAVYKKFFLMLGVTVLLCLSASVVWSETMDDLVKEMVFIIRNLLKFHLLEKLSRTKMERLGKDKGKLMTRLNKDIDYKVHEETTR